MKRASWAKALLKQSEIILYDEPTGALNSANSKAVLDVFSSLHNRGQSIVMVTHDDEIIERYPSRRLKISDGALLDCDGDTNVWAMESSAIICWWCQHYNETISWNYTIFLYYICA